MYIYRHVYMYIYIYKLIYIYGSKWGIPKVDHSKLTPNHPFQQDIPDYHYKPSILTITTILGHT